MSESEFKPQGQTRPNQIYVSRDLFKALGFVARKEGRTREDVAEAVLNMFMAQAHPEIVVWLKKREAEETEFVKGLKLETNNITI